MSRKKGIEKVLVTGGAGFIGSWVVDELLRSGYRVVVLDTLAPPTHDGKRPAWLDTRAQLIRGSVTKKKDWQKALKGVDAVIHLAARMDYHLDFSSYIDVNVRSIALLFELVAEKKTAIRHLILASSQAVYGEGPLTCSVHGIQYPEARPESRLKRKKWEHTCARCERSLTAVAQAEGHEPHPINPYGLSKLSSEQLAFNLGHQFDVPVTAFRYSIVLGPRQSFRHFYSGALRAFAVDALTREEIFMQEDGKQVRDFVDVRDLARTHIQALGNQKAYSQSFNIGSGRSTKIFDLAELVAKTVGVPFRPSLNRRYRVGTPRHGAMNITKVRKALRWTPKISLQKTLVDHIQWLSAQKGLRSYIARTERDMKKRGLLKTVSE